MTAELNEIMRVLGGLQEGARAVAGALQEEKDRTSEHRATIYGKLDKLEETVSIVGQVVAQAREEAKTARVEVAAVRKIVDEDVKPATDDFKRMRAFGKWTITAVGIGATAFGITAATAGSTLLGWIKGWLGMH